MSGPHDVQDKIRAALKTLPREAEVPAAALALLEGERRSRRRRRRFALAAAALAALVAITAGVWVVARPRLPVPRDLADELALDHLHYEHHAEAAEVRGDPAAVSAYFAHKLGFAPHYGAIEAATLLGAKPCRIAGKWTALLWLDRAGHWLSLFTMPEHDIRGRGCTTAEGVRVCSVPDPSGGARVLVGDLPESEMLRLASESLQ